MSRLVSPILMFLIVFSIGAHFIGEASAHDPAIQKLGEIDWSLPDLNFHLKLFFSVFCGLLIGIERHAKGKQTGIKTSIMISVGSMLFANLSLQIIEVRNFGDPSRVLGQIVAGIGFLGAGAIFSRQGSIIGLTSASVVWVNAAVGAAVGFGFIPEAVIVTVNSVLLMLIVGRWERSRKGKDNGSDLRPPDDPVTPELA